MVGAIRQGFIKGIWIIMLPSGPQKVREKVCKKVRGPFADPRTRGPFADLSRTFRGPFADPRTFRGPADLSRTFPKKIKKNISIPKSL